MRKIFKHYYRFIFRYKWRFLVFALAMICFAVAESVQPYFYKLFIDAITKGNEQLLFKVLVTYVSVRIAELLLHNLSFFLSDRVIVPAAADARMAVFKKIQDLDFAYHLKKSTGSLISAIKRGDNAFFDTNYVVNIQFLRTAVGFAVILFFFSKINWQIGLLMIASFAANLLAAKFLIKQNISARKEANDAEDKISEIIVDNLINFETVKLFARENWEQKRLKESFKIWSEKLSKYFLSFKIIDFVVGIIGNLGLFLILLVCLSRVSGFKISPAEYLMVVGFISSFYPRFFEMVYDLRNLIKHQTDMVKYFSVFDEEVQVKDPIVPMNRKSVAGDIEFKNVTFYYPETKNPAVKNLNLKIRAGQSWAFVGHSGVGKTTVVKLLMRFYDPQKGKILLDGIDIKNLTKSRLRSFIGIVPQEPILFNDTVGYNIAYGIGKATKQEIVAAAKLANLHDFIETLPKKYETVVGERGLKLSGGQKQRMAIARMILSDPEIIIFDEATSQLDSDSEKKIQEAFWKAAKNKTTLIIAHRLSTIINAEKIAVMKKGQVIEIGSHRELSAKKGSLYRHFWRLQTKNSPSTKA